TITADSINLGKLSTVAAAHYVALFSVCRDLTKKYHSSNPTWLRQPRSDERKQFFPRETIARRLISKLVKLSVALSAQQDFFCLEPRTPEILLADSTHKTLPDDSIDLVVTSPPYCTRIDYAAATRIELAVLYPLVATNPKDLARQMTG